MYKHSITASDKFVDENGHINNVQYIQWMQEAAVHHSDSVGCTELTKTDGATWVVRTHNIEYLRPAYAGDKITVLTWISNVRKIRALRKYKFIRDSDGSVLATGETDWVYIDTKNGRPRSIPEKVINVFEIIPPEKES